MKTRERLVWMFVTAVLLAAVVIVAARGREAASARERLEAERARLGAEVERLRRTGEPAGALPAEEADVLPPDVISHLERHGTTPEAVIADLVRHPELIETEGVLGGSMHFVPSETRILTSSWVLATYEDGHVLGRMLLAYNLTSDGITWEVIRAEE